MNRRQSLRALAISSIGAAAPVPAWSKHAPEKAGKENNTTGHAVKDAANTITRRYDRGRIFLVAGADFLDAVRSQVSQQVTIVNRDNLDAKLLVGELAGGASMIWIGTADNIPKELSIGGFNISKDELDIKAAAAGPLSVDDVNFARAVAQSGFIAPPKEMPLHNIDEEVRADFLPVLEAYDRFGNLAGYPAVLMSYFAPSLAGGRFKGSECFFFFTGEPLKMTGRAGWKIIIDRVVERFNSGLQFKNFTTSYASYKAGERVQAIANIQNRRSKAVSCVFRFYIQPPGENKYTLITEMRRVPEGSSETQAVCDFLPPSKINGLWKVRLEVLQDVENAERLAYTKGNLQTIDRREIGFMILPQELSTPKNFSFEGPEIIIDNKKGFWAGTHYYPSTSWWEWVWRDFRPLKAAEDFAAIRRAGYRIVRIWIDPVLDEPVLRAMDAAIQLASDHGIVLDICVFTQWVRYIGFERKSGEQVTFQFRHPKDFNIVSFSLRNIDLQREYIQVLGARWKSAENIFYNIANEVFIKDPDHSQMDAEVAGWPENKLPAGSKRDTLLFSRWSAEMSSALRKVGANQPAVPGYMFSTMDGGDVYLGNQHSPVVPWHSYLPTQQTALTIQYFDAISSGRPLLLEEFGRLGWNNIKNYDENVHYALAAGAAAAMSYEWGVSWLSRESCYTPIPLLEACVENPDPRWFKPYTMLKETWSENGVGMCATPSGTGYGSVYHGTPFTAEAAGALGRLGLMGEDLQRKVYAEKVFVIIPETKTESLEIIQPVLKALWQQKLVFGVWQEKDMAALPGGVKAIICPVPLSHDLSAIKTRSIKVYEGSDSWRSCNDFEEIITTGAGNMDLIARRTANGLLCMLVNKEGKKNVSIQYKSSKIKITIDDFAMAHFTGNGIALLEGTGKMLIGNLEFCTVEKERAVIAINADGVKAMVTGPTRITFNKNIKSVAISDGFHPKPKPVKYNANGGVLEIDDQLAKYVIHVSFK